MNHPVSLNVTMQAVAEDAGVSRATASRVFSSPEMVEERTRQRVLDSAARLGYVRNEAATQLARKSSDTIGLLLRETINPMYAHLHDCLLREAFKRELYVATMSAGDYIKDRGEILRMSRLMQLRPAGIFVASGVIEARDLVPFASQVPTIVLARMTDVEGLHAVSYDEPTHARLLAEAVVSAGHSKVIVCVTARDFSRTEYLRATTIAEHLRSLGSQVWEIENQAVMNSPESLFAAVTELMRDKGATAVMFANDFRALNFMIQAKRAGLRVPEDLGVAGCDGIGQASELSGLLSVRVPLEQVCAKAADLMKQFAVQQEEPSDPVHLRYTGHIVGGETVGL